MHLILTHEHADFDAVASLVGAAQLFPDAVPIVPQSVNQNVRDFLTLYWDELPLVEFSNRPRGRVNQITMVDSQYIPPLRGRKQYTNLRVIDHHSLSDNLPPEAETILVKTGATATYLVEQIARANLSLTPIQATLLLLGIYEDCGSLTYSGTTPADIRAAAWLLDNGARLEVLRDFLNYALNPAQKKLYNAIINNLSFLTIQGRQILISAVHSEENITEVSSLAHKLRDLYNPEGLFLLVSFDVEENQYIQLVARSTTEAINVGKIAESFNGGGHPRAAAAHITHQSLHNLKNALIETLESQIMPAITVRQIMSFRVRTLAPGQTIQQAADLMTRYGHEGYPVVENNKIVGILTRREIDSALHHQLGRSPIKQYMHAGEIYVTPNDTVEYLQQLMLQERVGQIPVLENDEIIGVVTRTDLINLWSGQSKSKDQVTNLAARLNDSLPAPLTQLLQDAGEQAANIDASLFIVGGFVRDLLLNRPVFDVDLVVEGNAIALAETMQAKYGGRIRSHKRFGAANWITEGAVPGIERLDFVSARTEFYRHPTALPEVEQSSIKQDLHRRDFTINTLAIQLNPAEYGNLLDFYGGYRDLDDKLIRVLHSLSFVEDPTRILRAIRLEQRLNFHIGTRTLEHLEHARDLLSRLSADRIYGELEYTLKEAEPEKALMRLTELNVLQTIQPGLQAGSWFAARARRLREDLGATPWANVKPEAVHYFGLLSFNLSPDLVKQFIRRLRMKASLEKILLQIQAIKKITPALALANRPSQIYNLLIPYTDETILISWIAFDNAAVKNWLVDFSQNMRCIEPLINGKYLIERFGLKPSPLFTQILTMLRNARLDGEVDTLEGEHALVEAYIK